MMAFRIRRALGGMALAGLLPTLAAAQGASQPDEGPDFYASAADLRAYVSEALERNPTALGSLARYRAARQRVPQVAALPDPVVSFTQALRSVETRVGPQLNSVTLSQTFPWFGTLALRGRVALLEATALYHRYQATRRDIVADVKRTYYDLAYVDADLELAREEQSLLEHYETLARARYATGDGLQQAVIRLQAEIARVVDRRYLLERQRAALAAHLNTALDRPAEQPVPPVPPLVRPAVEADREQLYRLGERSRHELRAAATLIEGSERSLELARLAARPGFTASVGVTNVGRRDDPAALPRAADDGRNAVTVSVGVSLPLWGSKNRAGIEQARDELRAHARDRAAAHNTMEMEVQEALVRLETLDRQIDLLDTVLLPQTDEALRATETAYETGQLGVLELLDGERTRIDVRSMRARYLSDLLIALTALERAIGTRVPRAGRDAMTRAIAVGVVGFALGIAAAVLVAVNPAGWAWPPQLPSAFRKAAPSAAAAPMDAPPSRDDREILYWRAPMDPTFTSDRPGRSPMGMDLVPVYADGAEPLPPGTVRVDPGFTQSIGVRSEPVARRDIAQTIRTVGTLAHNDRQIAWVNTKYDGWIENVAVNYLGETVEEGQVLFDIYSPQLVTTQMEYLQAVDYAARLETSEYPAIAERARSLVASSRTRLGYWDITDEQIGTLERERTPRRTLSVLSPVTGVVVEKMDQALDGMYVEAGMNLYKMADLTTIWVEVEVFEHQVEAMRVGQRAHVELPYLPGRPYTGFVRYLYPHFDEQTRTMTVSIELENPDLTLRAGMYANVTFDVPVARNALAVPEEAVIRGGTRDLVVLERSPGTFQVAAVTLGRYGDGVWEVLDGIDDGDTIVLSAQFLIDSESNLTAAIRNLDSGTDMAAMPAEHGRGAEQRPSSFGAPAAPSLPVGHRHGTDDAAMAPDETGDVPPTPAVRRH